MTRTMILIDDTSKKFNIGWQWELDVKERIGPYFFASDAKQDLFLPSLDM